MSAKLTIAYGEHFQLYHMHSPESDRKRQEANRRQWQERQRQQKRQTKVAQREETAREKRMQKRIDRLLARRG